MQRLKSILVTLILGASALAVSPGTLPRQSPEFDIYQSGGKTILLSSFKGKVVVIEFLFLGSQHCQRVAQTLNKLHGELGVRGFQPIGIVFGPNASEANVYAFVQSLRLTYPVGYTNAEAVDSYFGRQKNEILNIPQVVVIDRAGMILAQSGGRGGDPKLENEDSLRVLLDALLKESPPAQSTPKILPR